MLTCVPTDVSPCCYSSTITFLRYSMECKYPKRKSLNWICCNNFVVIIFHISPSLCVIVTLLSTVVYDQIICKSMKFLSTSDALYVKYWVAIGSVPLQYTNIVNMLNTPV